MKFILPIFAMFILFGCQSNRIKPTVDLNLNIDELPSQESWNSQVIFSDSGRTTAVLDAGHFKVFDQSQITVLDQGIEVVFYDRNEHKTTTLTAKRGKVDGKTNNLFAMDSVVAVSDSGVVLKTENLMFRNKDQKIVTKDYVTIISSKEIIKGYGFESDRDLKSYTIYKITYQTQNDSTKNN